VRLTANCDVYIAQAVVKRTVCSDNSLAIVGLLSAEYLRQLIVKLQRYMPTFCSSVTAGSSLSLLALHKIRIFLLANGNFGSLFKNLCLKNVGIIVEFFRVDVSEPISP